MLSSKLINATILVVDNSRAVTGAINAMRHATTPLQENWRFVYVLPTGSAARPFLEADGYAVHELPFVEISRRKADILQYVPMLLLNGWRLWQLARREGATLIHLNDFYNLTGYVAGLLSIGRIKVITHVRFLPQVLPQPLARTWAWLARTGAARIICVSEAVRSYFGGILKVQVVYDPLSGKEHHPVSQHPARPDGTVHLLYLSNYIQGKGQDLALAAFRVAYSQDVRLRLRFVGGDMGLEKNREFKQMLEEDVRRNNLDKVVAFDGFAADVEGIIKQADIVLNFSEAESFSLTCLDALYFGTPLIASDCGGPAELFENGKSGVLVPNRDVAAMANAIVDLAADAALRQSFSAAGRLYVRQKFASNHTYEKLATCYRQVLTQ